MNFFVLLHLILFQLELLIYRYYRLFKYTSWKYLKYLSVGYFDPWKICCFSHFIMGQHFLSVVINRKWKLTFLNFFFSVDAFESTTVHDSTNEIIIFNYFLSILTTNEMRRMNTRVIKICMILFFRNLFLHLINNFRLFLFDVMKILSYLAFYRRIV